MGERLYLVYEPFPTGGDGVPLGLFASAEMAMLFMTSYFEKYYNEPGLAIMVVPANDTTNLHSYFKKAGVVNEQTD